MKAILFLFSILLLGQGCADSNTESRPLEFKDVKKAVKRPDGLYNVICFDGSIETGISLQQIELDQVCNGSGGTGSPQTGFLENCAHPPSAAWEAALQNLAWKVGQQDCQGLFEGLKSRQSLQFFAYPPAAPNGLQTLEPFRYFPQLTDLGVYAQNVSDVSPLADLKQLKSLRLGHNRIQSLENLVSLQQLQYLDLSHNEIGDLADLAKFPPSTQVEVQDNPKANAYQAVPLPSVSRFYRGTLLLTANDARGLDLDRFLTRHERQLTTASDVTTFVGPDFDAIYGANGTLTQEIQTRENSLQVTIQDVMTKSFPKKPGTSSELAASAWFNRRLQGLGLSAEEAERVRQEFGNYCDAKIVELAAHPVFAKLSALGYKERPSPQPFCEQYYAEQNYFRGPECAPGGDAFRCLWVEGVLKKSPAPARDILLPIFDDPAKSRVFQLILQSDSVASAPYINASSTVIRDQIFNRKRYYFSAILGGRPSIGTEAACVRTLDPSFSFICGSFARAWGVRTPLDVIVGLEQGGSLGYQPAELKLLGEWLNYFGARTVSSQVFLSRADILFFQLLDPSKMPAYDFSDPAWTPEFLNLLLSFLDESLQPISAEDRQKINSQLTVVADLRRQLTQHLDERIRLMSIATDALGDQLLDVNLSPAALAFVRLSAELDSVDTVVRLRLHFGDQDLLGFVGCFDRSQQKAVDCPADDSREGIRSLQIQSLDPDGRIVFSHRLDTPAMNGWPLKVPTPSLPDFFSRLTEQELTGAKLIYDLRFYQFQKTLPVANGSIRIEQDGKPKYEGVIAVHSPD